MVNLDHSGVHLLHSHLAILEANKLPSHVPAIFYERLILK